MLILANSRRNLGRCIAAKEVVLTGGRCEPGNWIRPVAPLGQSSEGELGPMHCSTPLGRRVQVLDFARADFEQPDPALKQPENWRLAQYPKWEIIDAPSAVCLEQLIDHPKGLWDEPRSRDNSRRISVDAPEVAFGGFSLALIQPKNFFIQIQRVKEPWRSTIRTRSTGFFEYAGNRYACQITDDSFEEKYCRMDRNGSIQIPSPFGDECLLCMSLGAEFKGHHYKLIAAVISLLHRDDPQSNRPL